jgi:CBS domain-containing protein
VTDRDLTLTIVSKGLDAKSTKVGNVMTHKVVTCHPEDDLEKVMDAMAKHQLRRIPVVDTTNKVVGIIAQADVAIRANGSGDAADMVKEISQPNAK